MNISRKRPIIRLLISAVVFLLMVFIMDFIAGAGLKYIYYLPKQGKYYREICELDHLNADILIMGSSRAQHHYVSQAFEDSLHETCYNAGYEGAEFLHQYALLMSILQRYSPKIVIWDYWRGLENTQLDYDELAALLPFYEKYPYIRTTINLRSKFEPYKMISKVYPYNSTIVYNLNMLSGFYKNSQKDEAVKGYVSLRRVYQDNFEHNDEMTAPLDSNCIKAFKLVTSYCKQKKIKLFIVMSPYYGAFKGIPNFTQAAKNIAESDSIPFLDFSQRFILPSEKKYFGEPLHLNADGAEIFTNEVIEKVKNYNYAK